MGAILLRTGTDVAMEQMREYFDYLFRAEQTGDPFPVDLDTVWPFAYTGKANAKRALVESNEFYEGEDYHFSSNAENPQPGSKGGRPSERIVLSIQCFEYFIARKVRPIFEIYRQCRLEISRQAAAAATAPRPPALPYHLRRYLANQDQVPFGYFGILQELTTRFVGRLEARGYTLPDDVVPDISVGLIFNRWLREVKGEDPGAYPNYPHTYEDGRVVQARCYPIRLLPDFVAHFHEEWLANRAAGYFGARDQSVLPHLTNWLTLERGQKGLGSPEGGGAT